MTIPQQKPPIVVRPSPIKYTLRGPVSNIKLPYRMVYAIATTDAVVVYDTQQSAPIAYISGLHYATFTDIAW